MIIPDIKKAVTVMMARRSPKGERLSGPAPMKVERVMDEELVPDGQHSAAQDILSAIHEKSPDRLKEALCNFLDMHQAAPEAPAEK